MAKMNLSLALMAYADPQSSNNPALNIFRWARDVAGLTVDNPTSEQFSLAPGETRNVFNGSRTLTQDNTTHYSLALKAGSTSTYALTYTGVGTAPGFRAARVSGADAGTHVTVTKNGAVLTIESTVGTFFSLIAGGVIAGDRVFLGSAFSIANQGEFKVLSRTAVSFTIENPNGIDEASVTLGAVGQVHFYSAAGVQVGDIINIFGSFSPSTQGAYVVTRAQDNLVEFFSTKALPDETQTTNQLAVYTEAKRVLYVEADQNSSLVPNSGNAIAIEPLQDPSGKRPGIFMRTATTWSLSVTNDSLDIANYYIAAAE